MLHALLQPWLIQAVDADLCTVELTEASILTTGDMTQEIGKLFTKLVAWSQMWLVLSTLAETCKACPV